MPGTGFTVLPGAFVNLSPSRAVELFRHLLWAEADRVGVGRHLIDVPDCINVGDGGVDAYIYNPAPYDDDVIPNGSSVFQVKSGDLGPAECRQELHVGDDLGQPIKPELSFRLERGAAYVIVLMVDIPDVAVRRRQEAIQSELGRCGHENNEVRVYTANQIAGFASRHPSLVTALRPELSTCSPYEIWAGSWDVQHPAHFVPDSERQSLLDLLAGALRGRNNCPIIRVMGLPGVGKTRTVFEALHPDDLRHQVLYVQNASDFVGSELSYALANDETASAIVVVDECDLEQHRRLAHELADRGPRLALITMYYETGNVPRPTSAINVSPLDKEKIEEVLKLEYPNLPPAAPGRLAEFADGYPYIAVLLASQYLEGPESETFLTVSDDLLMNRLIGGTASLDSAQFTTTKKVLMGLSLFQRIGVADAGSTEGQWLSQWIGVSWPDFQDAVARAKDRRIVQGDSYVFVTPFMLRIHLLEEWWRTRGFAYSTALDEFVDSMPPDLRTDLFRRFVEQLPYVSATNRGAEFARRMLGSAGALSNYELLNTELGSSLFLALTQADPTAALATAQRVIGVRSREELIEFRDGRRNMVEALLRMAVWKEFFQPAANLLLALAEAETESWANNATGVFADLFSTGTGPVASTEAPFAERLPVVEEALSSESPHRRQLGLQACGAALNTGPHFRMVGPEWQGNRREPDFWMPATYGEWFDAYRSAWSLIRHRLDGLESEEKQEAAKILLSNARGLSRIEPLSEMVVETLRELAADPEIDRAELTTTVVHILRYEGDGLGPETRESYERLELDLAGTDFNSRLDRYVAMYLDTDHIDADGNPVDTTQNQIQLLADAAVDAPDLLNAELHWLVTTKAKAGHNFGYELGLRDLSDTFLETVIDAQTSAGDDKDYSFIGGYLHALGARDPERSERLLDTFAKDPQRIDWVVELTWRTGSLTERRARRILDLTRSGVVAPASLRVFRFGAMIRSLSYHDFLAWIDVLLVDGDMGSVSTALDLLVAYYPDRDDYLPQEPAFGVLEHPAWFTTDADHRRPSHDAFWWSRMAASLCRSHPDKAVELARLLLEHLGDRGTIVEAYRGEPLQVLNTLMQQKPRLVWQIASALLGPPVDSRAFRIANWLQGNEAFGLGGSHILEVVPYDAIWEWVDEDLASRPSYLATFVPKAMRGPGDQPCLAREVLVRYGQNHEVRDSLCANFSSEGWTGPESQHLASKLAWLQDLRGQETDPNVLIWIDEYSEETAARAEFARQEEERRGW